MLNNNMNPMMNNMNPNMMMFNPMMNNMNPNMIMLNPMMNNMNNQNMNQMNMMIGNNNNLNQSMNEEIYIIIKSENNKLDMVSCFENDSVDTLRTKLDELNLIKGFLIYNYRVLKSGTLKDNGIINGSIINIKSNANSLVFKNTQGTSIVITLDVDCPFNMAIMIYVSKLKSKNLYKMIINKSIVFLFNGQALRINDETPIKLIFPGTNPNIFVNDYENVKG